jgi:Zn-dependent M28 family amino/carboxypeptidase
MSFKNTAFTTILSIALIGLTACSQPSASSIEAPLTNKTSRLSVDTSKAPDDVKLLIEQALESSHAYDITRELTTEIGARLAGTEEEARARDWTVAKFKEIGLENVRIEPFPVKGWVRGVETAKIVSPFPQDLYITSLGGSVATPEEGITAEVVCFPTFDDLENAPEGGLDGKIVFISGLMEKAPDGAGYGPANRKRQRGATEAGKRGATAVIIRSVGTDSHRFPHTGQMRYAEGVEPIPIGALSSPDADQLERIFEMEETVTVHLTLTPKGVGDLPSGNVIGEIVGTEHPEEIILISGHLDSWDLGTGALDDGAGIGISAGAAQVILESGLKPKRTIRVVAYGAEEVGLVGAFAYAKQHKDDLDNHILATESDFGAGPVYEVRSGVKAGEDVLQAMADAMGLPMSDLPTTGGPDIIPLFNAGVPAMRMQQDGTDYFDYHHTPDDTFDKIVPEEMAQNVAAFVTMAWMASEADTNFRADEK